MEKTKYFQQAELLLKVIPSISNDKDFALKGGTAINFFVQDLPRLSVDIDLTYLPLQDRPETLANISAKLKAISEDIKRILPNSKITHKRLRDIDSIIGLVVNTENAAIKLEVNPTIRGTIFEPETLPLCKQAEDRFELYVEANCLSIPELYGSKICAALDRQHPRDLFDINLMFENYGFIDKIRQAFIFYLISHNRPLYELLNPTELNIEKIFNEDFEGMTSSPLTLNKLIETREVLIETVNTSLKEEEKKFLLTFKKGDPDWSLVNLESVSDYPSVKWKLHNIRKMDSKKHKAAYERLEKYLFG